MGVIARGRARKTRGYIASLLARWHERGTRGQMIASDKTLLECWADSQAPGSLALEAKY
jgi:hypothetical protein